MTSRASARGVLFWREGCERLEKKYQPWVEQEGLVLLEGWAREGLTEEQIAQRVGIRRQTLWRWKKQYPQVDEALRKGKEVVDFQVESALLKNALGGNLNAQIFWLKNRRPDKYRDKHEGDAAPREGVTVIVDV